MKIYPDTKIYIICPGNFNSGGPESLHQLCSKLIEFGLNAAIFYVQGHIPLSKDDPVHDDYKKYKVIVNQLIIAFFFASFTIFITLLIGTGKIIIF